ncbi:Com family DNA-binding transcriptional regulator [Collimonas sp. OK412]|uniref:Com family DNA-binding transcriptional regulator n=1 Tax=Collimonas sp. (strain OK412) TaxID=1801619 RepID=UPI000B86BA2C|nr:Com family DNA-binding transcriptional regulator [Collimonas sp. OK412]
MQEIRCGNCSKKLGEGEYIALAIKCPRCSTLNHLRATRPAPVCHRASDPVGSHVCQTQTNHR